MIKILPEKKPNKKANVKPHYILEYDYMIGDANGNTSKKVKVSKDNPYVERYCKLLNKLKPTKGHWGVMLEKGDRMYDHVTEKQITEDDFNFLKRLMFEEYEENCDECECDTCECGNSPFEIPKEHEKYANEFHNGVTSNTEYSFLVFEGVSLYYIDEFGKKHNTSLS